MIRAVVTDIEGTTSALSAVRDVLFPYARAQLRGFVERRAGESEVRAELEAARALAALDAAAPDARIVDALERWGDEDRKVTPLKALQGLVWEEGFRAGALRGHVYADVAPALRSWRAAGLRTYIYSSGSVRAQRLFFEHTAEGDLRALFDGGFDTTSGAKGDAASYVGLARAVGCEPRELVFLSDVAVELDAARAAGWHTVGVAREGTEPGTFGAHPVARSFADVALRTSAGDAGAAGRGRAAPDVALEPWAPSAEAVAALARFCHGRGWSSATSGNYSVRAGTGRVAVSASGRDKGEVTAGDVVAVGLDGCALDPGGPPASAEARLHCALYRRWPAIGAVAHTHSVAATVLSRRHAAEGVLRLVGYEMGKALAGVTSHEDAVIVPIVPNSQDMDVLERAASAALEAAPGATAYLVAGHGLTTWGRDAAEVRRHVEGLEFLLACALHA